MSFAGFLKGFAKSVLGILLGVCIIFLLITSSFAQFTEYSTIKPITINMFNATLSSQMQDETNFTQFKTMIEYECMGKETFELPQQQGGRGPLIINCSEAKSLQNIEQFKALMLSQFFDKIYFYDYGCDDIIKCFKMQTQTGQAGQAGQGQETGMIGAGSFIILSKTAHDSFAEYITYLIIAVVVLAGLLLLFRPFSASLRGIGISFVIVGLGTFVMPNIKGFIEQKIIPADGQQVVAPALEKLFEIMKGNFFIVLIIGIALLAAGIVLGIAFKEKKSEKQKAKPKKEKEK